MKIRLFLPSSVIFFLLFCTGCNPYRELDSVLGDKDSYDKAFEQQMDLLKSDLQNCPASERWGISKRLFDGYVHYKLDSCQRYVDAMIESSGDDVQKLIISKASQTKLYYRMSYYTDAIRVFESIDTCGIGSTALIAWCSAGARLYSTLSMQSIDSLKYNNGCRRLTELMWETDSTNIRSITELASLLIVDGSYDDALEMLFRRKEHLHSDPEMATVCYRIGQAYMMMGEMKKAIPYLAESALLDTKLSIMNNASLFLLAEILYGQKDYSRASRYLEQTIENNKFCEYETLVNRDYNLNYVLGAAIRKQNKARIAMSLSLFFLSAVFLLALALFTRKMRSLNAQIKQASKNKNKLIAKYLELSANYIYSVDEYKSKLRKTAREYGADAVLNLIKTSPHADSEFTDFKNTFDEFFLWMYPSFIDDVNRIMLSGHKIEKPVSGLNTDLRILAMIWLGISDRRKISKILNISVQSVYTYHSILQKNSICPGDGFDKKVAALDEI